MRNLTKVIFDEILISVNHADGSQESVKWDDLEAVLIKTTAAGPFTEDVFFVLVGKGAQSGCVVPQGAVGENELFTALQKRLPGFDNELVVQAMMSTEDKTFLVWKKTNA
jgi:YD repeat-containing protein